LNLKNRMPKIMKCPMCGKYTLKNFCKSCNQKTREVKYKFKKLERTQTINS